MESPPSRGASASDAATSSRLPWFGVLLYIVSLFLGTYLGETLEFPGDGPGQDPPWYFIRRHLIQDVTVVAAMLFGLLTGAVASQRRQDGARSLLLFCFTIGGLYGWRAVVILMKTRNVMSPELATTSWPTFEAYFGDSVIWIGRLAFVAIALILLAAVKFVEARREAP